MSTHVANSAEHLSVAKPPMSREEMIIAERKARRFWGSLIIGLLGLQVAGGITAIYLSVGDPSIAVVPNYHQAALNWDVSHRSHQVIQQLGWKLEPSIGVRSEAGTRTVTIAIRDASAIPVEDLRVNATIYHHARGSEVEKLLLTESEKGVYVANSQIDRDGLWQVSLQIEGSHGVATESYELTAK